MADEPVMTDDEKLELRRDWNEFYNTDIVQAIVDRQGNPHDDKDGDDKVKEYSAYIVVNNDDAKLMRQILKRHSSEDLLTPVINAVLELAKLVEDGDVNADTNLKKTYDLIDATNGKIKNVFVSKELLNKNLKTEWDKFTHEQLAKILAIKDDDTLNETVISTGDFEPTTLLMLDHEFINYSGVATKKESFVREFVNLCTSALNMYNDSITDEKKKLLYDKIKELNDSKLAIDKALGWSDTSPSASPQPASSASSQPALPPLPLHISISGNKYSVVGSKAADGSHKMVYTDATKCWNEENKSGGATKSKRKKRGLKSKSSTKSSAKSRPKSRRY
jgi:hypothetical protein